MLLVRLVLILLFRMVKSKVIGTMKVTSGQAASNFNLKTPKISLFILQMMLFKSIPKNMGNTKMEISLATITFKNILKISSQIIISLNKFVHS